MDSPQRPAAAPPPLPAYTTHPTPHPLTPSHVRSPRLHTTSHLSLNAPPPSLHFPLLIHSLPHTHPPHCICHFSLLSIPTTSLSILSLSMSLHLAFLLPLLLLLSLLSLPTLSDVLRLSCGNTLTVGRVDPIISPGAITSNHAHTVYGASAFSPTVTYASLVASKCATCQLVEDNSVYWFPTLYYHNVTTNTYTSVEQSPPGAAIYYLQRTFGPNETITAFPPGFRMIAGNMGQRTAYTATDPNFVPPVNFVCLNYQGVSSQSDNFPNVTCVDGLRAQLTFPSCWDGVNLDSPTHNTHVSYAVTENLNSGPCPTSHPVRIPALFAEVIWQTSVFPTLVNGVSPFVWSFTTPTTLVGNEYGYHGDFVNGWNVTALQATVTNCTTFDNCPHVTYRPDAEASSCGLQDLQANSPYVTEHLLGVLPALIQGTNTSVVNVNPYGAVNTVTSPPVCSTFPLVDYSTSSVSSYTSSAPPVPAGTTYIQSGQPTLSCAQAYSGWHADTSYATGGSTSNLPSSTVIVPSPLGAALSPIEAAFPVFSSNRYGGFTYTIPVSSVGWYGVRLLFVENYWASIGARVFSVTAQGVTVISHLDLNTVGPNPTVPCTQGVRGGLTQTTSYIFNTTVHVDSSLTVKLTFVPIVDNPIVSAVEVFPVSGPNPTAAPPTPTSAFTPHTSGSTRPTSTPIFPHDSSTGAVAPRSGFSLNINCGSTISFTNSLGQMFVADQNYSSPTSVWAGTPNNGAAWTNTTSDMYPLYNSNRYGNVRYVIPVPSAGQYQVTLHYAEMYWTAVGRRVSSVAVQGVVRIASLDLIAVTGHEYSAYTTVHIANVTAVGLNVSLAILTIVDNALVSGIEISKIA